MKNKTILAAATWMFFGLTGCVEHEIIPAPEKKVSLVCHFEGTINGTDVEWTQNVQGYALETNKSKLILPSPTPSSAVYFSEIKSSQTLNSIKLCLGFVNWDASVSSDPTLALFNGFMTASGTTPPLYKTGAANGFEVIYRDGAGVVWTSKEADAAAQTILFTNIVQESDATGDYSKFTANFTCTVYHVYPAGTPHPVTGVTLVADYEASLPIVGAEFKGWFKR